MTPKQRELLDFIEAFTSQHRFPPSFEEMRVAVGIAAKSGVWRLLEGLEEQGEIIRPRNRNRSVRVIGAAALPAKRVAVDSNDLAMVETGAMLDELHRRGLNLYPRFPIKIGSGEAVQP